MVKQTCVNLTGPIVDGSWPSGLYDKKLCLCARNDY